MKNVIIVVQFEKLWHWLICANQYIDQQKPWQLVKEKLHRDEVQAVCTQGLNLFKILATYLQPILPATAAKIADFFQIPALTWENMREPLLNHTIATYQPLMQRVRVEEIAL